MRGSIRAEAHGRAAHAVMRYLHGHQAVPVRLHQPVDRATEPAPKNRDQIEERIRLLLSVPAAEMLHLGAETTYLAAERPEIKAALAMARQLGGDEPVDHLERCLDDTLASLKSPRIRHAIGALGAALMRAPRGEMGAAEAQRTIRAALRDRRAVDFDRPGHPRTIYVRAGG